jgi:hypothetical protein
MTAKDAPPLHLIKLCVGAKSVEDLEDWQAARMAERRAAGLDPRPVHVTRMWPKRADEIVGKGSLFWVFRGQVLARQRIVAFQPVDEGDGVRRCGIVRDPAIIRTVPQPRRAFQGWRYLSAEDAPIDLPKGAEAAAEMPEDMRLALTRFGVL